MGDVHCWEAGPRTGETWESIGIGSTCLLLEGHDGPHEFTRDDRILVRFVDPETDR